MAGSRDSSLSEALCTVVPIPQAPKVPAAKSLPTGWKHHGCTRSVLSPKLLVRGQATVAQTPAQPLTGNPGRDAKDPEDSRDLAPLCHAYLLPARAGLDAGMLLVIQPLGRKKLLCSNRFPYSPSKNTDAFIPWEVLLGREMLLLCAASWGR